ncbi:ABC transporter ATP-binding protein YxdL [bioreactor metagenome]|uniref:ABC transporter ATP-binding protein YxdL n=1 Tax=bioreactor metagenome TaxID=1076179 RepID=A0A645CYI3_9ZZZZ
MVTHSTKAASHANRVLFIKDGTVYHQLYRTEQPQEQFYQKIADSLTVLSSGGNTL